MTIQERILDYLKHHPEGVDDDALTVALGLAQRQQANQRCRTLEKVGIVTRQIVNGKIRNFFNATAQPRSPKPGPPSAERAWYWEGHVQAAVVRYIQTLRFEIGFVADTATKQQGKDVIAVAPSGQKLWISAKGYPLGTVKTNPRTQARHWFSHALFDLILWHGEDTSVALAIALPNQTTYRNLAARVRWFLLDLKATIYWVHQDGKVEAEEYVPAAVLSQAAAEHEELDPS